MEILLFETASYCTKRNIVTSDFNNPRYGNSRLEISATSIREFLRNSEEIPPYFLHSELSQLLRDAYKKDPDDIFCN